MILFGFRGRDTRGGDAAPPAETVSSFTVSEKGLVRKDNQDHVFVDNDRRVYCVADGMGGGSEGALASEMVCRDLKMLVGGSSDDFDSRVAAVQKAVDEANTTVYSYARENGFDVMGSTVAILVIDPADRKHAAVCTVGDSRIYRIRHGMPELLTRDHRMKKGGNTLTRAIGVSERVKAEWTEIRSSDDVRFVLCTDGVHDVLSEQRMAVFAAAGPLNSAADRLSADIMKRGAPDNFSFVLVSA